MNEKYERLGTPLEDYELTRRDRQRQRSLQEIREHARRQAAKMPPLPDEVLEKVAMLLSQPTPDSQIMRWRVRLFCGHIIEARRHRTMTRPADHDVIPSTVRSAARIRPRSSRTSRSALPPSQPPRLQRQGPAPGRLCRSGAENTPLTEVSYVSTLLWTIGAAIAASIVLHIVVAIASPKDADKKDQRDREINRFGEYTGQSFVVIGGVAALGMSMVELSHFWIANVIYLAFVLSSILGSAAKIVAYRRGFQPR